MKSSCNKVAITGLVLALDFGASIFSVKASAQTAESGSTTGQSADSSSNSIALDDIVVTAERLSSSAQKTAASLSVREGRELARQGRFSVQDILYDVPGVTAPNSSVAPSLGGSDSQGGGIIIRGIAANPGGGGAGTPLSGSSTTAVYTDGVYEGIGGDYDLQRLEVLRGPQGTLYGRSATSGVVAIYTTDPTFDRVTGDMSLQFGRYSQHRVSGAVNVPLSDEFAIRAALVREGADRGYRNGKGDAFDRTRGRIKALYQPTANFSALLGFAFDRNDGHTGGCRGTSPADGEISFDTCFEVRPATSRSYQYWANLKWDLGPVTLSYLPAYRTFTQSSSQDQNGPFNVPMSQVLSTPRDTFLTQELRLSSNGDGKLSWQGGLFQYWNSAHTENANRWTQGGALLFESSTRRDIQDYGVFGEAKYAFSDRTRLTVGARYDYTRVNTRLNYTTNLNFLCNTPGAGPLCPTTGGDPGTPESPLLVSVSENTNPSGLNKWKRVNYKVRLDHDLTPHNLLYAMVSTGFVPGDVTVSCSGPSCAVQSYDAETLTAFEVGSKNRFFGGRLQINADAFVYRYGGMITEVNPDPNNPVSNFTTTVPVNQWGVELESYLQVGPGGRLGLKYTHLDIRYGEKPAQFASEISWNTVANAGPPNYNFIAPNTVNISYDQTFSLKGGSKVFARLDGTWTDKFRYFNPSNSTLNSAFIGPDILNYIYMNSGVVGNFSLNWTSADERFSVGAYVHNFTDRRWTFYDVRSLTPRTINATQTEPRTFGVLLSAHI